MTTLLLTEAAPLAQLFTGTFQAGMMIFLVASFLGFEVISRVPQMLHTPLMSGANAISGITVVGGIAVVSDSFTLANLIGFVAIIFATVNVVGGFLVTDRMIKMFRSR